MVSLEQAVKLANSQATIPGDIEEFDDIPLPDPFYHEGGCVFEAQDKCDDICITLQPFKVISLVRNEHQGQWGHLLTWLDPDTQQHFAILFDSELHSGTAITMLRSKGLKVMNGQNKKFIDIVNLTSPDARIDLAQETGWRKGKLQFVTGDEVIEPDHDQSAGITAFVPADGSSAAEMATKGTLQEWCDHVANPIKEHPLGLFVIGCALAVSLMRFLNIEVGGFHLFGRTSRGKTTLQQVFTSVFGNGCEPGSGGDSCIRRWDSTANGLEAIAAKHHDIGLALDEIGAKDPKDIRFVVYNLFSGRGKTVMNSNRKLVAANRWRTLVLSSGEKPLREVLAEGGGETKAGQLVRLADIPIDSVELPREIDAARLIQSVKRATGRYYGTPQRTFIKSLINITDDEGPLSLVDLTELIEDEFHHWEGVLDTEGLAPEQARVNRRFVLVQTAGSLASQISEFGFSEEEFLTSVRLARDLWIDGMRNSDPGLQGLHNIAKLTVERSEHVNKYLDRRSNRTLLLLTPQQFADACAGVSEKAVIAKLTDYGLLHRQEQGRARSNFTINGKKERYYAIRPEIKDHYLSPKAS